MPNHPCRRLRPQKAYRTVPEEVTARLPPGSPGIHFFFGSFQANLAGSLSVGDCASRNDLTKAGNHVELLHWHVDCLRHTETR